MGVKARVKSAQLILDTLIPKMDLFPIVVTGDFNVNPETEVYQTMTKGLKDAFYNSEMPHHGPQGTFTNGFLFPGAPGTRIDYIFTNNQVKVLRHAIISENWSGIFPSDHLPVYGKILIE
jgi:endonuclease/exonuclease/phosphatase family metal-dependent hydrolase